MKDADELLNLNTFLKEAALHYTAVDHFERMGFIKPWFFKYDGHRKPYYSLKEARRIGLMQSFLLGKVGPVKNLRQANEQACKQIP